MRPEPIPIWHVTGLVVIDRAGRRWPWRCYWPIYRVVGAVGAWLAQHETRL